MYPIVELPNPEHVAAYVLALLALTQIFYLSQILKAADKGTLVLLAGDCQQALQVPVGSHGTQGLANQGVDCLKGEGLGGLVLIRA